MKPPFHTLTAAEKRVAIAKDAIKQIELRRYRIKRNRYLEWPDEFDSSLFSRESLRAPKATCRCCQIGACIASGIRLFNERKTKPMASGASAALEILKTWFEPEQVVLIERAFESDSGFLMGRQVLVASDELSKAATFGATRKTDRGRALAIFRNIIANKGEFIP